LAELGPHYDSLNERVIPTVHNAAAAVHFALPSRIRCLSPIRFHAGFRACLRGTFGAEEGLADDRFWRDHEASMTQGFNDARLQW
jgi:hypothetical protein